IGLATVCRYVHETVDVLAALAALAESLPAAMRRHLRVLRRWRPPGLARSGTRDTQGHWLRA
ncbi:hypothetical protein, partial [Streptomyces antimycoticus]|uniref:hypothetical protein n=1 Tax=Streptomyces antimycoticus TaxID=68175 RepID=UPI0035E9DD75